MAFVQAIVEYLNTGAQGIPPVNGWGLTFGSDADAVVAETLGRILPPPSTTAYVSANGSGFVSQFALDGSFIENILVPSPATLSTSKVKEVETSSPTGLVRNNTKGFKFSYSGRTPIKAKLIVATEDGQILAWNPKANSSFVQVYLAQDGAVYKDLALVGKYLYATDFFNGKVDVFDDHFNLQDRDLFSFTDPSGLPVNYNPFGIKSHNEVILVSYALSDGGKDDLKGNGFGVVNAFDPANGGFLRRLVNVGGNLNSPFGFAQIPKKGKGVKKGFLSGNFGDGRLGLYDDISGHQKAVLVDRKDNPIVIPGLWSLVTHGKFVYFAAGGFQENEFLFGRIKFL